MPLATTRSEALLFHHFTNHLGRWLDCTNASRIFTLTVTEKALLSPILFQAVLCFAARHRRDESAGEAAYKKCVTLLIERLGGNEAYDECLLAAVLLLHFADQLGGKKEQGPVSLSESCSKHLLTVRSRVSNYNARQAPSQRYIEHSTRIDDHPFYRSQRNHSR